MYNYFMLIGTIKNDLDYLDEDSDLIISSQRPFKNENGKFEVDDITVKIPNDFLMNVIKTNFKQNQIIGIKGRMVPCFNQVELIAERIINMNNYGGNYE